MTSCANKQLTRINTFNIFNYCWNVNHVFMKISIPRRGRGFERPDLVWWDQSTDTESTGTTAKLPAMMNHSCTHLIWSPESESLLKTDSFHISRAAEVKEDQKARFLLISRSGNRFLTCLAKYFPMTYGLRYYLHGWEKRGVELKLWSRNKCMRSTWISRIHAYC